MKTYEVSVRREGRWWMVEVPELDGLTQARRLDEVERVAREFIAVTTDVPLSKVAAEVSVVEAGGRDLLEARTLVDALRRRAKDLEALIAELTREVASALTAADVPVRDVSSVLGVSHQRVSQLVQSALGEETATPVIRRARREFIQDLEIRLDDGRSLRLVEVVAPASARSRKPQQTAREVPARAATKKKVRKRTQKQVV